MVRQLRSRYGREADAWLADAGFQKTAEIDELATAACGTTLYLPVRTPADPARDPHQPLPDDSPAVAAWRVRMGTSAAKELYIGPLLNRVGVPSPRYQHLIRRRSGS